MERAPRSGAGAQAASGCRWMPLDATEPAVLVLERLDEAVVGRSGRAQSRTQLVQGLMVAGDDRDDVRAVADPSWANFWSAPSARGRPESPDSPGRFIVVICRNTDVREVDRFGPDASPGLQPTDPMFPGAMRLDIPQPPAHHRTDQVLHLRRSSWHGSRRPDNTRGNRAFVLPPVSRADLPRAATQPQTKLIDGGAPEIAQARRLSHHLPNRVVETYSHVAPRSKSGRSPTCNADSENATDPFPINHRHNKTPPTGTNGVIERACRSCVAQGTRTLDPRTARPASIDNPCSAPDTPAPEATGVSGSILVSPQRTHTP